MKKQNKKNLNNEELMLDPSIQRGIENQYRLEIKRQISRNKKQHRIDTILTALIIAFIITVVFMLLKIDSKMTDKQIDYCINNGHSESYCYDKLA